MMLALYLTTLPRIDDRLVLEIAGFAGHLGHRARIRSGRLRHLGIRGLGRLGRHRVRTRLARLADAAPWPVPSMPKITVSNFFFSALLSKLFMTIAFTMVTLSPFFTFAVGTAAQVSPWAVFRRR